MGFDFVCVFGCPGQVGSRVKTMTIFYHKGIIEPPYRSEKEVSSLPSAIGTDR